MTRIRNISVCGEKNSFLRERLEKMGYFCSQAAPKADSLVRDVMINESCGIVAELTAIETEELIAALTELAEKLGQNRMPLCIVICAKKETITSSSFPTYPSVKCFPTLPDGDILAAMLKAHENIYDIDDSFITPSDSYITDSKELERQVTEIIQKIGIPANVKGYRYLRNAIVLATKDISILDSVTKILYPTVAEDNSTTPTRVERAIRHAISTAWDRGSGDVDYIEKRLHMRINYAGQRPTNSELIAMISDCMRLSTCR